MLIGNKLMKIFVRIALIVGYCFSLTACGTFVKNKDFLKKNLVDDSKLDISNRKELEVPIAPPQKIPMSVQEKILDKASKDKEFGKKIEFVGGDIDDSLETSIDFDEASLQDVVNTFSDLIGMNLILGSNVQGKVTIKTHNEFKLKDAFKILHSILEIYGLTTIRVGDFYKIVPLSQAKQYPIEMYVGNSPEKLSDIEKAITQIVPLTNIPVAEMVKILQPFLSKGASVITHKETNMLILNDLSSNVIRLLRIINLIDIPAEMNDEHRVYVYYVKNKKASDLSSTLNSIYKRKGKKKSVTQIIRKKTTKKKGLRGSASRIISTSPSLSEIEGEVTFVADKEINALIIKTTPRIYPAILKVVAKLDIMPRQVLIEVLIADITLTDDLSFSTRFLRDRASVKRSYHPGASESLGLGGLEASTASLAQGLIPGGFYYSLWRNSKFITELASLASNGQAKILASPHLVTTDNKTASVSFGEQIPIPTSAIAGTTGTTTSNIIQTSVQYKDVSTKLDVTPNINQNGQVTMEVKQEISELGACPSGNF